MQTVVWTYLFAVKTSARVHDYSNMERPTKELSFVNHSGRCRNIFKETEIVPQRNGKKSERNSVIDADAGTCPLGPLP